VFITLHRLRRDSWLDAFTAEGRARGSADCKLVCVAQPPYDFMNRGYGALHLSFTYDSAIVFQQTHSAF
jgi:hypothetical protein